MLPHISAEGRRLALIVERRRDKRPLPYLPMLGENAPRLVSPTALSLSAINVFSKPVSADTFGVGRRTRPLQTIETLTKADLPRRGLLQ